MMKIAKTTSITSIVDSIFEDVPYSDDVIEAKNIIADCLEKEFLKETETLNETQAIGKLMYKYGTLSSAGALAGYSEREIQTLCSNENVTDENTFRKLFKKQKIVSCVISALILIASIFVVNVMIYKDIFNIFGICFFSAAILVSILILKKNDIIMDIHSKLNVNAYILQRLMSDRYRKRLINTIFLTFLLLAYYALTIIIIITKGKNTFGETMSLVAVNSLFGLFVLALLSKNVIMNHWLDSFFETSKTSNFDKHKWRIVISSIIYWIIAIFVFVLIRNSNAVFFAWYTLSMVMYCCLWICYNLLLRKKVVRKNIVINIRRSIAFLLVVAIMLTTFVMKKENWILQPYISTVPAMEYIPDNIAYNEETGVYSLTTDKSDFKILQLTDIHLGGSTMSSFKDYEALTAIYKLIDNAKPDFIVVTGDLVFPMGIFSYSLNNTAPIIQFCTYMRNIGIPWAFIYGNHDTEDIASASPKEIENIFISASFKTSRTLLYPYVQPDITGRNNQLIEIKNSDGSLRQALFLLDSNDYTGNGINDYDYIHDDQVDWYRQEVLNLKEQYGDNASSLLFFHMPLQEYKTADELYESGSSDVKYFFGENGEKMIDKVCCSKYHSKIFDTALELGSTKAMFCGHDHYNNSSIEYKGIRLTYGLSIDYLAMPGIDKDVKQRGATLITIDDSSKYSIEQIRLMDIE